MLPILQCLCVRSSNKTAEGPKGFFNASMTLMLRTDIQDRSTLICTFNFWMCRMDFMRNHKMKTVIKKSHIKSEKELLFLLLDITAYSTK